jgi:hypothetical protein
MITAADSLPRRFATKAPVPGMRGNGGVRPAGTGDQPFGVYGQGETKAGRGCEV